MAVDTALYVGDFDTAVPAGGDGRVEGDDNFRQVKTATKNSFPSVTGAVTKTHTQINDLAEKSTAQTISGDWTFSGAPAFTNTVTLVNTVDEFSTDVTLAGNSDTAIPTEKAIKAYVDSFALVEWAHYEIAAAATGDLFYLTTQHADTINGSLATITSNSTVGWILTATEDISLDITLNGMMQISGFDTSAEAGIYLNEAGTTLKTTGSTVLAYVRTQTGDGDDSPFSLSAHVRLSSGDDITLMTDDATDLLYCQLTARVSRCLT